MGMHHDNLSTGRVLGVRIFEMYYHVCKGFGSNALFEPRYEKTGFLHMRKQRRRSAPLFSLHG